MTAGRVGPAAEHSTALMRGWEHRGLRGRGETLYARTCTQRPAPAATRWSPPARPTGRVAKRCSAAAQARRLTPAGPTTANGMDMLDRGAPQMCSSARHGGGVVRRSGRPRAEDWAAPAATLAAYWGGAGWKSVRTLGRPGRPERNCAGLRVRDRLHPAMLRWRRGRGRAAGAGTVAAVWASKDFEPRGRGRWCSARTTPRPGGAPGVRGPAGAKEEGLTGRITGVTGAA